MKLVEGWQRILTRAYSVRFQLFNAICVGMGSGIFGFTEGWDWTLVTLFVSACVGFQLAPILARIMWQADFHPSGEDD